ncbi:hypothetical protein GQ44DRAFT_762270 [Phaeosphaeriaceae sp. PMI808]|nr:hypothetical protein GQ44DRAFT_762270 [Phaeosphaeriaceae sp. PMI808]
MANRPRQGGDFNKLGRRQLSNIEGILSGHRARDNGYGDRKHNKRQARSGNERQTTTHPQQPQHDLLNTSKLVPLADRISRGDETPVAPHKEHSHAGSQGSRKRPRTEETSFEERKKSRLPTIEDMHAMHAMQSKFHKADSKTTVKKDVKPQEKRAVKPKSNEKGKSDHAPTRNETHKFVQTHTIMAHSEPIQEVEILSAVVNSVPAERRKDKALPTPLKNQEPETKNQTKPIQVLPEFKAPTKKPLKNEGSLTTVMKEDQMRGMVESTDSKICSTPLPKVPTSAAKRPRTEEREESNEHMHKKLRVNLNPDSLPAPEQTIEDQSGNSSVKPLSKQTNATSRAKVLPRFPPLKLSVKPASSFAPVVPNPECDHQFAEYNNDSVPILHSIIIKRDQTEALLNYPSIELKQEALALIERGFKSHDFGRKSEPKKGSIKVIHDCDLYLLNSKIHVATERGLLLAADYLKLAGISESTRIRFHGVKPAWAKASVAARYIRRCETASYWVPGPYPKHVGPEYLELETGCVVEVYERHPHSGEAWGKRRDTGKVGWFLYTHTVDMQAPYPPWEGLFTIEQLTSVPGQPTAAVPSALIAHASTASSRFQSSLSTPFASISASSGTMRPKNLTEISAKVTKTPALPQSPITKGQSTGPANNLVKKSDVKDYKDVKNATNVKDIKDFERTINKSEGGNGYESSGVASNNGATMKPVQQEHTESKEVPQADDKAVKINTNDVAPCTNAPGEKADTVPPTNNHKVRCTLWNAWNEDEVDWEDDEL